MKKGEKFTPLWGQNPAKFTLQPEMLVVEIFDAFQFSTNSSETWAFQMIWSCFQLESGFLKLVPGFHFHVLYKIRAVIIWTIVTSCLCMKHFANMVKSNTPVTDGPERTFIHKCSCIKVCFPFCNVWTLWTYASVIKIWTGRFQKEKKPCYGRYMQPSVWDLMLEISFWSKFRRKQEPRRDVKIPGEFPWAAPSGNGSRLCAFLQYTIFGLVFKIICMCMLLSSWAKHVFLLPTISAFSTQNVWALLTPWNGN